MVVVNAEGFAQFFSAYGTLAILVCDPLEKFLLRNAVFLFPPSKTTGSVLCFEFIRIGFNHRVMIVPMVLV